MSNCPYVDDQLIDDRPSFFNILSLINLYKNDDDIFNFQFIFISMNDVLL